MTPSQVNEALPTMTTSKFITQEQAEEAVRENRGRYLIKGRSYTAPIGLTVRNDLQNGANGIDEWVKIDGGNAYILVNFRWITVSVDPQTTQLHIEFDTFFYED